MSVLNHTDRRTSGDTLLRQPVVHADRSVFGYSVRAEVHDVDGTVAPEDLVEDLVDQTYATLDPTTIAGDRPLMMRATTGLLMGRVAAPAASAGIAFEIPAALASLPETAPRLIELRLQGYGLALGDYSGTAAQDALLPFVDLVKVSTARTHDRLEDLITRAHDSDVLVIAERVTTTEAIAFALDLGVDLLQGPMFERRAGGSGRDFAAGELQCIALVNLLSQDSIDHEKVVRCVEADPELSVRVLHMVNSSAFGVRNHIDSVRQAIVFLGPRQLTTLAMASLVDAQPTSIGELWSVLARALACGVLGDSGAAYTVGLLSAVAAQQDLSVDLLVERSGVSDQIAHALRDQTGVYGPVLAAVMAHEENDIEGVTATGLVPSEVASVYLAAVSEAHATATALAGFRRA
jgi:EAL and modified HD-GYP domain-containing signal transduction protein